MKMSISVAILFALFSSCEFRAKLLLSKKSPVIIKSAAGSYITDISIGYLKNEIYEVNMPPNTSSVSIDSLILTRWPIKKENIYIIGTDYSISLKTNKGTGGVIFHIDEQNNIIVTHER